MGKTLTTASALIAFRDELNDARFRPEHVERLVELALRDLLESEGLLVKAPDDKPEPDPEPIAPVIDLKERLSGVKVAV